MLMRIETIFVGLLIFAVTPSCSTPLQESRPAAGTAVSQAEEEDHAITAGLEPFSILDEGYVLHGQYDGQGAVLLTTEHDDAMEQVAWARQTDESRVLCLALGHDNQSWTNPGFREILRRGIAWCAGRQNGA
jgi:type 1 glutamine amidotransferase